MQVHIYPFQISLSLDADGVLSVKDFFEELKNPINPYTIFSKKRHLVFMNLDDDYYVGLLLSLRDYNSHCQLKQKSNGIIETQISEIRDGTEYNFFILNKHTLKGCWLEYHLSASISVFSEILNSNLEMYAQKNNINTSSHKFRLKNSVRALLILSSETVQEALKRFNQINFVEYNEREIVLPMFSPDAIKYQTKKIFFNSESRLSTIIRGITSLYNEMTTSNLKIQGKNEDNKKEVVNLDHIFRPLAEENYDTLTRTMANFTSTNLPNHYISQLLINLVRNNAHIKQIVEAD